MNNERLYEQGLFSLRENGAKGTTQLVTIEKKGTAVTVNEPRNDRLESQQMNYKEKILWNLKSSSRPEQTARFKSLQNRMPLTTG